METLQLGTVKFECFYCGELSEDVEPEIVVYKRTGKNGLRQEPGRALVCGNCRGKGVNR